MIGPKANTKQITAALDITQGAACDESHAGGQWVTVKVGEGMEEEVLRGLVGFLYRGRKSGEGFSTSERGLRLALIDHEGVVIRDTWWGRAV